MLPSILQLQIVNRIGSVIELDHREPTHDRKEDDNGTQERYGSALGGRR